jgi:hypothetical protein
VIRRYFEPSLATLMIKDQKPTARRGEVGTLDFDPFVNAQDWRISSFDIAVVDTASWPSRPRDRRDDGWGGHTAQLARRERGRSKKAFAEV